MKSWVPILILIMYILNQIKDGRMNLNVSCALS